MTRADIRRVFVAAVIIFFMGVIVGMCLKIVGVDAAAVTPEDELTYGSRALIEGGGMPCMEVTDELQAGEEEVEKGLQTGDSEVAEAEPAERDTGAKSPVYAVGDEVLPEWIQDYAYKALDRRGISWWYPYFIVQAFQESSFNLRAVSSDGLDYGLLQYRAMYWGDVSAKHGYPGADIYDPYVQIEIYADQVRDRLNKGLAVEEVISRHKTSDYAPYYDSYYVSCVTRHLRALTAK
ncbi:MAG: hypothetical protein IJM76_06085 [Lachnospiraceae bacterium]|nr:hypothetical protein [Lachnospiraceae bacterium]